MTTPLLALPVAPIWWWVIGIAILILLLTALGRSASRSRVVGQRPPEQGPDIRADQVSQNPDIRPEDQKQNPPKI